MSYVDCTRAAVHRKPFFSPLPHQAIDDPRLKPRDLTTLASILRFARAKTWASMSNRTLAGMGKCQERTIQLSLARLEHAGWIRRVKTAADIGSATGRLIYLTWREGAADCAPSPSQIAPPLAQTIAPEVREHKEKEKPAPMGLGSPGPIGQKKIPGPRPPAHRAAAPLPHDPELFTEWLARPAGDPLRVLAERALAGNRPAVQPSGMHDVRGSGLPEFRASRGLDAQMARRFGLRVSKALDC